MKRWTLVASFVLFILVCASIAYWGLQLFKPPLRPVAAPPRVAKADINPDAAATLFGARAGRAAVASNYQLKGVVMSGSEKESVAILSADGKPAQAVRVDAEVSPGVTVKEVHRDYVLLSDDGVVKRVELPENAKSEANLATVSPLQVRPQAATAPARSAPSAPAQPSVPAPVMSVVPGAATSRVPAAAVNPAPATTSVAPATSPTAVPPSSVVSPSTGQSAAPGTAAAPTTGAPTSTAPAMTPQNSGGAQQQAVPDAAAARRRGSSGFRQ